MSPILSLAQLLHVLRLQQEEHTVVAEHPGVSRDHRERAGFTQHREFPALEPVQRLESAPNAWCFKPTFKSEPFPVLSSTPETDHKQRAAEQSQTLGQCLLGAPVS